MAFYGGDPDNFEYPRFDLDVCIFRVYENGQPVKVDNYLKWNSKGPSDGELTFVSGSPGRTDRQLTVEEMADRRDREVPNWLRMFTKLKDADFRKDLYAKDAAALQAAHDPMLDVARMIDAPARAVRKIHEAQEETKQQAYAEIAKARFAVEGTSNYPDATFTLRLSYGKVRGYEEDGKQIPAFTKFRGTV